MSCESHRQLLLDLDLDASARRRIAAALAHLEGCDACRSAVDDFDRVAALVRAAGGEAANREVPDELISLDAPSEERNFPGAADAAEATPAGGWDAFEKRMGAAMSASRAGGAAGNCGSNGAGPWRFPKRWLPAGGAIAASLLVGWIGYRAGRTAGPSMVPVGGGATVASTVPARSIDASDVAQRVRAFGEVDEVFDGRTGWLLLSANASDLGLTAQGAGSTGAPDLTTHPAGPRGGEPGRSLLLVRLSLARGGVSVSDADVVIVPGTTATVAVPAQGGPPVRYQIGTSAADPMRLAIRLEVAEGEPGGGTAVLGTSLSLQAYRGASAGRLVTSLGAYELTVAAAASNAGAMPSGGSDPPNHSGGKL